MSTGILESVREKILSQPFHQACEFAIVSAENGHSHTQFKVNPFTGNIVGALHGGIMYAMLDVTAFVALATRLRQGQHAVSVDVHYAVLNGALPGETVEMEAQVDRNGSTLGFMRVEAYVRESDGNKRLIGTGHVTKAVRNVSA
ncbi:MAG TPA: PaaI family thioesterase [Pseudomonadales bacterium]|nr:PaaI family thioesterase [Pseudomonadales bacterium]